jgi:ABC-type sugar transport system permease subunit
LAFQTIEGTEKSFAGLTNFKDFLGEVFSEGAILNYSIRNSLIMYAVSLVICMPLYIFFAYLLFKKCFMNKFISFTVMVPQIMSGMVTSLIFVQALGSSGPTKWMFEAWGINGGEWFSLLWEQNTAFTTIIIYNIWLSFAMSCIVYPNAMRGINPEVLESAQIDGVNNMFQELWYIILPLIYPTMTTFLVTGVAAIFTNAGPLMELYHTNAPDYVYTTGYYFTRQILVDGTEFSYPKYAAGGLILTLISTPITLVVKWALEKFGPQEE